MNLGNSSVGMGNAMSGVGGIGQNNLLGGSLGGVPMDNSAGLLANPVLSGFSSGMQGGFQGGFQGGLPLGMGGLGGMPGMGGGFGLMGSAFGGGQLAGGGGSGGDKDEKNRD